MKIFLYIASLIWKGNVSLGSNNSNPWIWVLVTLPKCFIRWIWCSWKYNVLYWPKRSYVLVVTLHPRYYSVNKTKNQDTELKKIDIFYILYKRCIRFFFHIDSVSVLYCAITSFFLLRMVNFMYLFIGEDLLVGLIIFWSKFNGENNSSDIYQSLYKNWYHLLIWAYGISWSFEYPKKHLLR